MRSLSTLYHQNSADTDSLKIADVSMTCPPNVRLSVQTSSVALLRHPEHHLNISPIVVSSTAVNL